VVDLQGQTAGSVTSGLGDELALLSGEITDLAGRVSQLDKVVPDLATTAALGALTARVDVTVQELGLKHASALDTALNGVESTIANLQRETDDNADCCDANTANLANTVRDLGGQSLLSSLGALAFKALEALALIGLLETVATILNAPLVAAAMVTDVQEVSLWAESSAKAMEAVLGQIGPLGG
jgi:hypothetical protein